MSYREARRVPQNFAPRTNDGLLDEPNPRVISNVIAGGVQHGKGHNDGRNVVDAEYLPVLIGTALGPYHGYDSRVNAQVTQEFSAAAFRVGHSEVSETQKGVDNNGNTVFAESLGQAFFNTATDDEANGINALLRVIGVDNSQATDVYKCRFCAILSPRDWSEVGQIRSI